MSTNDSRTSLAKVTRRTFVSGSAALLGASAGLGGNIMPAEAAVTPNFALPMNGLFYGVDAPCDTSGNSVFKYRRPTAVRFRAEMTGTILAVRWAHRYNAGSETDATHNYSSGAGGTLRIELRRNDPALTHPPLAPSSSSTEKFAPLSAGDPNLLAATPDQGGLKSLGSHPVLNFTRAVNVTAGQLLWCVFNQLHPSEWVSINSAHIKGWTVGNKESVGGPYWGSSWHIARSGTNSKFPSTSWVYEDGTFVEESRHLVYVQFLYRLADGRQIWSGYGSVFANGTKGLSGSSHGSMRTFSDSTPIRMLFTPKRPTFTTSRLWWRAYRALNESAVPGNMTIKLLRGSTVVGSWTAPATRWVKSGMGATNPPPPPVPFVPIELGQAVTIQTGVQHTLVFGATSGQYVTHAQQVASGFQCRNSFTDGYAQYSTNGGGSWSAGWHLSGFTSRKDCVLPFMFEVLG